MPWTPIPAQPQSWVNENGWIISFEAGPGWILYHEEIEDEFLDSFLPLQDLINNPGISVAATDPLTGKLPLDLLPSLSITDVFVVANQTDRLAIMCETGDVAIQTDTKQTFILAGDNPANIGHWIEITVQNPDWNQIQNKPSTFPPSIHNHDLNYSDINHNHDLNYSNINHDHDSDYADINHNHDLNYSNINHDHDSDYADINHNHDSDYSDINHNHDLNYSNINHDHSEYSKKSDVYTSQQIDDFFAGESAGKKQVDWVDILNKPQGLNHSTNFRAGNTMFHDNSIAGASSIDDMRKAGWAVEDGTTYESQLVDTGYFDLDDLALTGTTKNLMNPYSGRGGLFVRAGATAGILQEDALQEHTHNGYNLTGLFGADQFLSYYNGSGADSAKDARTSTETRPANISRIPLIYALK